MATQKSTISGLFYECNLCHYITYKKTDYVKQVKTIKHTKEILATNGNTLATHLSTNKNVACEICNKNYKDRTGFWSRQKKCNNNNNINQVADDKSIQENMILTIFVLEVIKSNSDIHKKIFLLYQELF